MSELLRKVSWFIESNLGFILIGLAFLVTGFSAWLVYDPLLDGPSFFVRMENSNYREGFFGGACCMAALALLLGDRK